MATSVTTQFVFGDKTIGTAGTAEVLDATDYRVSSVMLIAKSTNTGRVFYGGSDVASSTQEGLAAGATITLAGHRPFPLSDIYIDVGTNDDGADFVAVRAA